MRVLVAYDNTDGARAALAAVGPLVRAANAEIVVLQVLNPRIDAANVRAPTTAEAMVQVSAQARAAIEAQLAELGLRAEVRVETEPRDEDDAETIVRIAREAGADMIAIGSRRAGGLSGAVLGSVVRSVVQHAHCPVIVVRPDHRP